MEKTTYEPPNLSEVGYDNRMRSRKRAVKALLSDRRWHENIELAQPHVGGHSFNVHIKSLREDGYRILSEKVEEGIWKYRMLGKGEPIDREMVMSVRQLAVAKDYASAVVEEFGTEGLARVEARVRPHYRCEPGP
jgi:hypothetical protein